MPQRRARDLLLDLRPLRDSRHLRFLAAGQAVSVLGTQMTAVVIPYQVFRLTDSSLAVGAVSLAALPAMLLGALLGGSIVDATEPRRVLVLAASGAAVASAGLAVNATGHTALWPIVVCQVVAGGLGTFEDAALGAVLPSLVRRDQLAAVNALFQGMFNLGLVIGPAAAGLLLASVGARSVYAIDAASYIAAAVAASRLTRRSQPATSPHPGLGSIVDGIKHLRGRPVLQGALAIDVDATVLGVPRALFPAITVAWFGGGAATLGLLFAAPGVGALVGTVASGWVGAIRWHGRAVTAAVAVWGLAIAGFGWCRWLPASLLLLAIAGCADSISAILRSTIIQLAAPEELRGRLSGIHTALVTTAPRLGDLEAGAVAAALGITTSVVSGGLGCVVGAIAIARALPDFRRAQREA